MKLVQKLKDLVSAKKKEATSFIKKNGLGILVMVGAVALTMDASASSDSTFSTIVDKLTTWLEGSLGLTFALGSLAVGLGIGIVKQSIMAIAIGCGMALACSAGPAVLTGIFSATL